MNLIQWEWGSWSEIRKRFQWSIPKSYNIGP